MISDISVFIISCLLLVLAGRWLVSSLARMARFLNWREFVVAFFIMAFAGAIPNFFIGISSAWHGIPQLSFGDVIGGNVIDFTIAMALAILFGSEIPTKSRTVQTTSIFTIYIAILPILLILDGVLGKGDGILLIGAFIFYVLWLFSKRERFTRIYEKHKVPIVKGFRIFIEDLGKVILGIIILFLASEGIIRTTTSLAKELNISLVLIGILIVAMGNSIPEIWFGIASAKSGEKWMVLGNLMGSIVVPSTLVLGTVAFIHPIQISDLSPFAFSLISLMISALFFLHFIRSDREVTKKEAKFLFLIYIVFFICQLLFR